MGMIYIWSLTPSNVDGKPIKNGDTDIALTDGVNFQMILW